MVSTDEDAAGTTGTRRAQEGVGRRPRQTWAVSVVRYAKNAAVRQTRDLFDPRGYILVPPMVSMMIQSWILRWVGGVILLRRPSSVVNIS